MLWRDLLGGCAIVVGAGGGGDVASAYLVARMLERSGLSRVVVASLVWERMVYDPEPGPIPLESLEGHVVLGGYSGHAMGRCWALRRGALVVPSACRLAEAVRRPVALLDCSRGEVGVRMGLLELADVHGCDTVLAVDVGGDIVAQGCEEDLWSPLADSLTLAATALSGLRGFVVVYAPGADGELDPGLVMSRLSELYDAYQAGFGLPRSLAEEEGWVVEAVGSEAGRAPIAFIRSGPGRAAIRGGSRRVELGVHTVLGFVLDALRVFERSPTARAVAWSTSIDEASRRLNEIGVFTELDLERALAAERARGADVTPELVEAVRAEGRRLLGWRPCGAAAGMPDAAAR